MNMSSKPKTSNVNNLLAAIQRKAPSAPATPEVAPAKAVVTSEAQPRRKAARRAQPPLTSRSTGGGKPVQFWLHDEDRQLVRELAAWLAGQGIRPTDTMVIRSILRTARTGGELLDAARQVSQ